MYEIGEENGRYFVQPIEVIVYQPGTESIFQRYFQSIRQFWNRLKMAFTAS